MVSNYILGMSISAIIGVGGTLAMAYINYKRGEMEQRAENKRVRAELMAEKEAEVIRDLSAELERNHRLYEIAVRRAVNNSVGLNEFKEEIDGEYSNFQTSMEEAMIFLSDDGEDALREYLQELLGANMYIRWKANQGGPIRETNPEKALRHENIPSNIKFDWNRFHQSYRLAKEGLKHDVRKRLKPLEEKDS